MFHFAFCLLFCVGKRRRERGGGGGETERKEGRGETERKKGRGETERKYDYIIIFYLCDMCKLHTQPTPWLTSHSVQ